ncbi:hypothetical protein GCM10009839_23560 [Catenulispora yoronensis]|uniref:Uncharacterized protein n=1 Tax=Catenulispora yoronensis TaxID=450799 RepID=A0ABN2TY39_9ACTN
MTAAAAPTSSIPNAEHHERTDEEVSQLNDLPAAVDMYWDDRRQMTVIVANDLPEGARGVAWNTADGSRVAVMSSVISVELREACLTELARGFSKEAQK